MSITDELREYARIHQPYKSELYNAQCADEITAIADRIDAEHEAMLVDARKTVYQGYIELPKDADGVPWNLGDRDEDGNEVIALKLASDGWFVITDGEWLHRPGKHHYHAPTVEDVLREFADEVYADADNEIRDRDFLCAKYAKRLTLAEGEDA